MTYRASPKTTESILYECLDPPAVLDLKALQTVNDNKVKVSLTWINPDTTLTGPITGHVSQVVTFEYKHLKIPTI